MNITGEKLKRGTDVAVKLDGRRVGTIRRTLDGWAYNPIRTKIYGEPFPTPAACLESLRKP